MARPNLSLLSKRRRRLRNWLFGLVFALTLLRDSECLDCVGDRRQRGYPLQTGSGSLLRWELMSELSIALPKTVPKFGKRFFEPFEASSGTTRYCLLGCNEGMLSS